MMKLCKSHFSTNRQVYVFEFLSLLLALACCSPSWAQMTNQGTVAVIVLDATGATVQAAKLQLQDAATNEIREAETQQAGSYSFVGLPAGTYKLTVTKSGFQTELLDSVTVQAYRVTDVKVTLKVGATVEKVVVSESSTPLLETTSSAIASTIDMKQVEDLPLQGRDISSLAFLTPGFTGTPGNGTWGGLPVIAQGNYIDGVQSSTNRMKFAGNSQPELEARIESIQEMTVQSGQSDLSQGLGGATMQVNFITRHGSNDFHGRVFEDFRNTALNANSWVNDASGSPRNPIILNDFGGNAGGHIIKDKLFYFASFAMSKQPGGFQAFSGQLLTPQAQQGIFAYSALGPQAGQTVNLFTAAGQCSAAQCPGGLPTTVNGSTNGALPQVAPELTLINKNIAAGKIITNPNDPNVENVTWPVSSPVTRYYPSARVDYNISSKLKLDFSFQDTKVNQPNASAPVLPGPDFANQAASFKSNNYITSLGLNWNITPSLINQFRGGYYYNAFWYSYGAKSTWTTLPQVVWALGTSGQSFNLPVTTYYPFINAVDNAAWLHGVHTITFGFDFYREQDHYWNPPDGIPNIGLGLVNGDPALNYFNQYFTNATPGDRGEAEALYATVAGRVSGVTPIGSGFPYLPSTGAYARTAGSAYNLDELQKGWGLYAQDSFKVTPHFTVNYGLRWDFTGDDHDLTKAYHSATPDSIYGPTAVGALFQPGVLNGNPNPAYATHAHQYAPWNVSPQPTIGLAWNPSYSNGLLGSLFRNGSTVIRAGFDVKRFTEPYQYLWDTATDFGLGFFQKFSLNPSPTLAGSPGYFAPGSLKLGDTINPANATQFVYSPTQYLASIPESSLTFLYGATGIDNHIQQPYVMEWNLGVQRQLGRNNVFEVRYVGHRSVHQWISENPNEVNIFENGFLKEFKNAQSNLAICMANPACAANPSFGNQGLAGQVPLPIFDAAFSSESGGPGTFSDYYASTGSFIIPIQQGAAGAVASTLAGVGAAPYICNLVGSSLSPCATRYGATSPGPYPLNFFQVNPLAQGSIIYQVAAGWGNYHALQLDFRQKQWHGMQFDVNYTWSHTLGLQPENYQGSASAWLGIVNEFSLRNLRQSYGPTTFDLRHVIHGSGTFDLPFGKGKTLLNRSGALDRVVGGWTIGSIVTYETGFPFQLFGGYNTFNDYGDGGFVLNGISKSQLQSAVGVFAPPCPASQAPCSFTYKYVINPSLITSPSGNCNSYLKGVCQNTTPGTFGVNPWLYGPHMWNADASLSKAIPFGERFRFTLQAEALNVFNHPNWGIPPNLPNVFPGANYAGVPYFGQAGLQSFTNVSTNNNGGARVLELRANITF